MKDLIHDLLLLFGVEHKEPSLLAQSIIWSTNASWIKRLVAHRQLDNWLYQKP